MPERDYQYGSGRHSGQLVPASGVYRRSLLASQLPLSSSSLGEGGEVLDLLFAQVAPGAPTVPAAADSGRTLNRVPVSRISVAGSESSAGARRRISITTTGRPRHRISAGSV